MTDLFVLAKAMLITGRFHELRCAMHNRRNWNLPSQMELMTTTSDLGPMRNAHFLVNRCHTRIRAVAVIIAVAYPGFPSNCYAVLTDEVDEGLDQVVVDRRKRCEAKHSAAGVGTAIRCSL